jgi:dipeptidyl aminopeptidase/acylaminoacyl peptidase
MSVLRLISSLLVSSALLTGSIAAPPPELPVAIFFKQASLAQLAFSPDGKRIACLVPYEHRMNLAVIDLENRQKNLLTNFTDNDVGSLRWAGNDRLIFTKDEDGVEYPNVYAVGRDGSEPIKLAGMDSAAGTSAINIRFGGFLARLPGDPKNYLVLGYLTGADGPDVCRMNLATGRMSVLVPNPGFVKEWFLDHKQRVRLGVSRSGRTESVLMRDEGKTDWEVLFTHEVDTPGWTPVAFDGDDRTLFVVSNLGRATKAIYRYDTQTRQMGDLVFGNDTYDTEHVIYDEAREKVVGVSCDAERATIHWIDAQAETRQLRINASLADTVNFPLKAAPDGSTQLYFSSSDRDPGVYYLFNRDKGKLEELAVLKLGIDPDQMAPMRPVTLQARDGLTLHGYLTVPAGREAKNLPLVLHPHGGPYGIRDSWGFDPEV